MAIANSLICSPSPSFPLHTRTRRRRTISPIRGSNELGVKIRVHNLWKKSPNGEKILEGISFEVKQGEVHGLIGPSGSGKSTVLRALNRLWEPPPSSVFLDGQDVTAVDALHLRRRVGMLFQTSHLFQGRALGATMERGGMRGFHCCSLPSSRVL